MIGARLISDGRDLRGRFDLAHFAALSLTCFANSALQRKKFETKKRKMKGGKKFRMSYRFKIKNDESKIDLVVFFYQRPMLKHPILAVNL